VLKVVREAGESNDQADAAGAQLLDALVGEGARQMLATALQAEVAAYIDAHAELLDARVGGWWSATARTSRGR
jgi:hypothetical protein